MKNNAYLKYLFILNSNENQKLLSEKRINHKMNPKMKSKVQTIEKIRNQVNKQINDNITDGYSRKDNCRGRKQYVKNV